MKTFLEFINEETFQQQIARMRTDNATFKASVDAKSRPKKPVPPDIFTGSRHSDGKTVQVSNQQTVTPDKPMVGKDDAVRKLLKQKGLDSSSKGTDTRSVYHPDHEVAKRERGITSGNKIQDRVPQEQPANKPAAAEPAKVQRPFPDKAPEKQFGQDTKMKMLKINRKITADTAKMNEPAKVQSKVGSLAVKQTGYPAAKKPRLAPAESQRASSGGSYKIQPGDNPTKIAQKLGLKSVKDLEAKNPGILKRAKRLKIGGTINR